MAISINKKRAVIFDALFLVYLGFKCYFFVAEMYFSGLASKVFLQPGAQK